ncbi:MAG: hypothetical protein AB7G44_03650 [Bacteroidia bacterium]
MKNSIKTLVFFGIAFMPVLAFSQNNTAEAKPETRGDKTSEQVKSEKSDDNSGDAHYKVSKRNKKVGKMKYEMCETKEIEKGTRKGEIKTVCSPSK